VSENKPTTNCKHCAFSIKDSSDSKQIGCLANRISAFRENGSSVVETVNDNESYYTIHELCNLFRDESWKHYEEASNVQLFDREDIYLHKAKEEITTSFGIVVYDEEEECEKLNQTIESIKSSVLWGSEYPMSNIRIVVSISEQKKNLKDYHKLLESSISEGWNLFLVFNSKESPKGTRDFDAFKKCVSVDYFAYCNSGAVLSSSTLGKINSSLNHKLEKIITFSQDSLFGPINFVMKKVATSQYLKYKNFQNMFEQVKSDCVENSMHKEL